MASDPTSSASPALHHEDALVPRRFSINPLHPFLLPLHFNDVSCLRPQASSTSPPNPPLQARGPTERYDGANRKNAAQATTDCYLGFILRMHSGDR